jgi:tRNA-dihydrouridine synthase
MGCPVKDVVKTGSGAALINTPELAKEIIAATKEGAVDLPVSIKTRIGYNSITIEEWMTHLLESKPAAVTLHLRTKKEMSSVEAHWDTIDKAVKLARDTQTVILANGDLKDIDHADEMIKATGVDGVMMGRAIFGNPWLFDRTRTQESISVSEKLQAMIEHAEYYEKIFGRKKHFAVMIKHLRAYAGGFAGAKELRVMMENVTSSEDVKNKINLFLQNHQPALNTNT